MIGISCKFEEIDFKWWWLFLWKYLCGWKFLNALIKKLSIVFIRKICLIIQLKTNLCLHHSIFTYCKRIMRIWCVFFWTFSLWFNIIILKILIFDISMTFTSCLDLTNLSIVLKVGVTTWKIKIDAIFNWKAQN